jgi:hypothetical protein
MEFESDPSLKLVTDVRGFPRVSPRSMQNQQAESSAVLLFRFCLSAIRVA